MNYIYDIALNFQKYYCEFFEWKKGDKISNIRKIPLYRISNYDFQCFINYDIIVDKEFLDKIRNDLGKCNNIMCLVSDGNMGMGILFNNNGRIIKRSSMIYDEEDEVCEYALEFDATDINYEKKRKLFNNLDLRFCRQRKKFLLNYLKNINNDMMWKYLYYECYGDEEEDLNKIKKTLLDITNKGYSDINQKLYNCINSISKIRN